MWRIIDENLQFMYRGTNQEFATRYMWWFFLIQKEPLPEHMIGTDPLFFLNMHFEVQNGTPGTLTDEALAEYRRCFRRPEAIHATCEDCRASSDIDLEMDEADEKVGRKIEAPLLALWASKGSVGKLWNVLDGGVAMPTARSKADLWTPATIFPRSSQKRCLETCCAFSLSEETMKFRQIGESPKTFVM
jgi:hypothetical protein